MGIEDAAVLSELFNKASPEEDFRRLGRMYEDIRRPRVKVIQAFAESNGHAFSLPDGSNQRKRDQLLQQKSTYCPGAVPNAKARFGSVEFDMWTDSWNGIEEVSVSCCYSLTKSRFKRKKEKEDAMLTILPGTEGFGRSRPRTKFQSRETLDATSVPLHHRDLMNMHIATVRTHNHLGRECCVQGTARPPLPRTGARNVFSPVLYT